MMFPNQKPQLNLPDPANVPEELKKLPRWVCWKWVERKDKKKPDKPPINPHTGKIADAHDPSVWTDYETACAAAKRWGCNGVGIVLTEEDPYTGIDLDNCLNPETGILDPWAQEIVDALKSYTERTPSGKGVRVVIRGTMDKLNGHKVPMSDDGVVEIYDRKRYFTVTGNHLSGTPETIEARQEELDQLHAKLFPAAKPNRPVNIDGDEPQSLSDEQIMDMMFAAKNGEDVRRLFEGDTSKYAHDDSAADMALCCYIAFYTKNREQIERIFGKSNLALRDKWIKRKDYRDRTIRKALELHAKNAAEDFAGMEKKAKRGPNQKDLLVSIGCEAELFHDKAGNAYATLDKSDHIETYPIYSPGFRNWLKAEFYGKKGSGTRSSELNDALSTLEAIACASDSVIETFYRRAQVNDKIYLDLGRPEWNVVEASSEGWHILDRSPVRFIRHSGMGALPEPQCGGSFDDLQQVINIDPADLLLIQAWLIGAMFDIPYPWLMLTGEQGSAKSSAARYMKNLIDPTDTDERALPKNEEDLAVAAANAHILSFGNLSHVSPEMADALSRLATGGSLGTRKHYTNGEEFRFKARRPVILNGINSVALRSDHADRSIHIHLPVIPENKRRTEQKVDAEYEALRPKLLGALLDRVVTSLANRNMDFESLGLPRMADFARVIAAADPSLKMFDAYKQNRKEMSERIMDTNPLAQALRELVPFSGTMTELYNKLEWSGVTLPKNASYLGRELRRLAPNLRAMGVDVVIPERSNAKRLVEIRWECESLI
jgi:hypothetical protein